MLVDFLIFVKKKKKPWNVHSKDLEGVTIIFNKIKQS
jgi:hypothetical protein